VITPRATRLLRTANLRTFRRTLAASCLQGKPLEARDRLVIVPTHGASALLTVAIEERARHSSTRAAVVLPTFITPRELASTFATRVIPSAVASPPEAREILMEVACQAAIDGGQEPPFRIRPGLVAEIVAFYDQLLRHGKDVATFERLTLLRLEPGSVEDRGAQRLVAQSRFLAAAFRAFERLSAEYGFLDDRVLRETALANTAEHPWRHVIVGVGDLSRDPFGLSVADWDLLARVPGVEHLDVVVTDGELAGAWHERVHQLLPGIEEVRVDDAEPHEPKLRVVGSGEDSSGSEEGTALASVLLARDREDEVGALARRVRLLRRHDPTAALDRMALVVERPLPYVYLAQEVLRSANVPCQAFGALPLAGEPSAAALDLILSVVGSGLAIPALLDLLRSPHFVWKAAGESLARQDVAEAEGWLHEHGLSGGQSDLARALAQVESHVAGRAVAVRTVLTAMDEIVGLLEPCLQPAPAAEHLARVLSFWLAHEQPPEPAFGARRLRARAAVAGLLTSLRDEYRRLDTRAVGFERVTAVIRRAIEAHTFAPRIGHTGVYVVDAESARFGEFDYVQLAGLIDGEWPERTRRNVFYSASVLRDLGWSADSERADRARAAFVDLLRLPTTLLTVSTFRVEDDVATTPSPLLDEIEAQQLPLAAETVDQARVFEFEVLALEPVTAAGLEPQASNVLEWRQRRLPATDPRFHGQSDGHRVRAYSLSSLERYQDCPFKYFASDVLRLPDGSKEGPFLSPRARGRLIHEVFERFFLEWDRTGTRAITVDTVLEARACFESVAQPMLAQLHDSDAALERARLFGSAVAVGIVDVVLGLEASSDRRVTKRWTELRFDGRFTLGRGEDEAIPIRGVVDRIDALDDGSLRVIDYKTGLAPDTRRALQVPVYALCAQEGLGPSGPSGGTVAEAAYISFTGPRSLVPVVAAGEDPAPALVAARERVTEAVGGVSRGDFGPRPYEPSLCRSCAFTAVCRKDIVDG
jgi:RecB family exonuclease